VFSSQFWKLPEGRDPMGTYRTAEVCLNGHVSTDAADAHPHLREKYCSKCGEPTITQCQDCQANIRGSYYVEGVISLRSKYEPAPAFCFNCGKPFPWTERKLKAAVDLVGTGGGLSEAELMQFSEDVRELTKDTAQVHAASIRFKKAMAKVGNAISTGVRDILADVLSDTAKRAISDQ
jgi:hypothetical protein